MSRQYQLTKRKRLVGNLISHANNKTKTTQQLNLKRKKIFDAETGKTHRLRLSVKAIRILDKVGSLSKFVRKYPHLAV